MGRKKEPADAALLSWGEKWVGSEHVSRDAGTGTIRGAGPGPDSRDAGYLTTAIV